MEERVVSKVKQASLQKYSFPVLIISPEGRRVRNARTAGNYADYFTGAVKVCLEKYDTHTQIGNIHMFSSCGDHCNKQEVCVFWILENEIACKFCSLMWQPCGFGMDICFLIKPQSLLGLFLWFFFGHATGSKGLAVRPLSKHQYFDHHWMKQEIERRFPLQRTTQWSFPSNYLSQPKKERKMNGWICIDGKLFRSWIPFPSFQFLPHLNNLFLFKQV